MNNKPSPEILRIFPLTILKTKIGLEEKERNKLINEVDELYIFPSKTAHSTTSNKTNDERMSISADISIIAKNSENIEHLLTPINRWQKF